MKPSPNTNASCASIPTTRWSTIIWLRRTNEKDCEIKLERNISVSCKPGGMPTPIFLKLLGQGSFFRAEHPSCVASGLIVSTPLVHQFQKAFGMLHLVVFLLDRNEPSLTVGLLPRE